MYKKLLRIENNYKIQELDNKFIRKYLLKIFKIRQNTLVKIKNKSKSNDLKTIIKHILNSQYGYFGKSLSNCELSYDIQLLKELIKYSINIKREDKINEK